MSVTINDNIIKISIEPSPVISTVISTRGITKVIGIQGPPAPHGTSQGDIDGGTL
jgi:hypothetical protein